MKKISLILAVFAIGISSNCSAIEVIGTPDCGGWITSRAEPNQKAVAIRNGSWLRGFISGLSVGRNIDYIKNHPSGDSLDLWMDNYCKNHPLDNLNEGVAALAEELYLKMQK